MGNLIDRDAKIYVAGHSGLLGGAIMRLLQLQGFSNLIHTSRKMLDLREQSSVRAFFADQRPDFVFMAAAKVGGIVANNDYPAEFIFDNIMIETNVIDAAYRTNVQKLLFLGSTCIYPRLSPQPINEKSLLTGPLEPTNEWYAIAKIAGIKLCQAYQRQYGVRFISALPTNLYGPGDNYDLTQSHVMPALIRKFHEAKINDLPAVKVWGSGKPLREFLHVDDCARACLFLMNNYEGPDIINIGTGKDIQISDLAQLVKKIVGYTGNIIFDTSRPDGAPRKLVDIGRITALGWQAEIELGEGIASAYQWYLDTSNAAPDKVRGLA